MKSSQFTSVIKTLLIFCIANSTAVNLEFDTLNNPIPENQFKEAMHKAADILKKRASEQLLWLNGTIASTVQEFKSDETYVDKFCNETKQTFVQTLITQPNSEVAVIGDLHDDAQSLLATLQRLKLSGYIDNNLHILDPYSYLVPLGDYTDRGKYGIHVWYLLSQLLIANPEHVFLLRGNHEEVAINQRFGFTEQLINAGYHEETAVAVYALYGLLPVALYLGSGTSEQTNFIMLNHGGIELGFDPKPLLQFANHKIGIRYQAIENCANSENRKKIIDEMDRRGLKRAPAEQSVIKQIIDSHVCGFNWADFMPGNTMTLGFTRGRGPKMSIPLAKTILEQLHSTKENIVHATIHGHEHNNIPQANGENGWYGCNVFDDAGMWRCDHRGIATDATTQYPLDRYPMYMIISTASHDVPKMPGNYSFAIVKTAASYNQWTIRLGAFNPDTEIKAFREKPVRPIAPPAKPMPTPIVSIKPPPVPTKPDSKALNTQLAKLINQAKKIDTQLTKGKKRLAAIDKQVQAINSSQKELKNKKLSGTKRKTLIKKLKDAPKQLKQLTQEKKKLQASIATLTTQHNKTKKALEQLKKHAAAKLGTNKKH